MVTFFGRWGAIDILTKLIFIVLWVTREAFGLPLQVEIGLLLGRKAVLSRTINGEICRTMGKFLVDEK